MENADTGADNAGDLVWWVLVDGETFLNNPVADASEAMDLYEETVVAVSGRGVSRSRVSLVCVDRQWGWDNYTGS